jgi:hypothetical protein
VFCYNALLENNLSRAEEEFIMKWFSRYFCFLFLAAVSPCLMAQSKPNALTPKEVAEGWILLWDGETTFGWESFGKAEWKTADGILSASSATVAGCPATLRLRLALKIFARVPTATKDFPTISKEGQPPDGVTAANSCPQGIHHRQPGECLKAKVQTANEGQLRLR